MRNIVSFSPYIPYRGIDHAGGEYLRRHMSALSEKNAVTIVSPSSHANRRAEMQPDPASLEMIIVPRSAIWTSHRLIAPIRAMINTIMGPNPGLDFVIRTIWTRDIRELVRSANIVEFQWTQTAIFSRFVRRISPQAKQILIAHDIISQQMDRKWRSMGGLERLLWAIRAQWWRVIERRIFRNVDQIVVFSEKDRDIARQMAPHTEVVVLHPPLMDEGMPIPGTLTPRGEAQTVLFTGALGRDENEEAMLWFLRFVWPQVILACPNANLVVAGAAPSKELIAAIEQNINVELTGYVDELDAYYKEATVFVVPLLRGAGVKFKTIIAMLWGVPVVATPVGAEGVGCAENYIAITASALEFAAAVIEALTEIESAYNVAKVSHEWAHSLYSSKTFYANLASIYL